MKLQLLRRRAEMFDAVCTGLHPSAVNSQLAKKYCVSENALRRNLVILEEIFQFFGACQV